VFLVAMSAGGVRRLAAQSWQFEVDAAEEIEVDAESLTYDRAAEQVGAVGDVVIRRGDTVLRADEVRLDRASGEAEAIGNVRLSSREGEIFAEHVHLDLDDETGALTRAELRSDRFGYSVSGDRIEKGIGHRYHIENGEFTTCRCDSGPPSWSISSKTLDVDLDGYGVLDEGRFKILGVPVLYVPRLALPIARERQSGLLFPEVGFSNRRGFRLLQPFYWAINKSQDLTLSLGVETSARIGLVSEYRYALSRDFHGSFNFAYYNEEIRGAATETRTATQTDPDIPENRWGILAEHNQKLLGATGYMDLEIVGDDQFLREINTLTIDYSRQLAFRTLPFTTSRVGLLRTWDRVAVQGEALVYQDLDGPQSLALQRLPELRLLGQKVLGYGLQGRVLTSAVNFQRQRDIDGLRFDLQPGLQLRLPLGRALRGTVSATFHETAYQLTDDILVRVCADDRDCPAGQLCDRGVCESIDPEDEPAGRRLSETQSRETIEIHAQLGTDLGRAFGFRHFGVEKLKHTIEPRLQYLYVPDVLQDDVPIFDGVDRINGRNLLTYGFATRLLARMMPPEARADERGPVYELARFSVFQSYDFERSIEPFGGKGRTSHFSNLDFALRVNPARFTSVHAGLNYDPVNAELPAAAVGIDLHEPFSETEDTDRRERLRVRNSFGASYRFISDNVLQLLQARTLLRITDRIGGVYATRYDVQANRFLENYAGIRLVSACDCWSLDLGVSDTSNPNEVQVRAQVSLVGLGSVGPAAPGRLGY
jgi:LPS-assembly protein